MSDNILSFNPTKSFEIAGQKRLSNVSVNFATGLGSPHIEVKSGENYFTDQQKALLESNSGFMQYLEEGSIKWIQRESIQESSKKVEGKATVEQVLSAINSGAYSSLDELKALATTDTRPEVLKAIAAKVKEINKD
jgi:hypothetical protein